MNIETREIIERLKQQENHRHERVLDEEGNRHAHELKLISALEDTFQGWETEVKNSKSAESKHSYRQAPEPDEPAPVQRRRGRPPKSKAPNVGKQPDCSAGSPNGYQAVRQRIARAAGVNVAAEARAWIATRGDKPFAMDEIVFAIHTKNPSLNAATVKSRLFPFFQHLEEKGQLTIEGNKHNHTYTRTSAFDPTPKKSAGAEPVATTAISEKERAWRELRGGIAQTTVPEE